MAETWDERWKRELREVHSAVDSLLEKLIQRASRIIHTEGFVVNGEKTRVMRRGGTADRGCDGELGARALEETAPEAARRGAPREDEGRDGREEGGAHGAARVAADAQP